jgi:hypothetical protein
MALKKLFIAIVTLFAPLLLYGTGTLTISGTITSAPSEQDIIDGGRTIILTLSDGATWDPTKVDNVNSWKLVFTSSGNWSEVSDALTLANPAIYSFLCNFS